MEKFIRFATINDAEDILKIYASYFDTSITFEYEVPSLESFKQRMSTIMSEYPYLVYVVENQIVGYAYANKHKERAAYHWNAELSVYVDRKHFGVHIGKNLCLSLLEILKYQNIQNVYAVITSPNERSENLHKSLGFEFLFIYKKTGYKLGKWHDVAWYEKSLNKHEDLPAEFINFNNLDKALIKSIIFENS